MAAAARKKRPASTPPEDLFGLGLSDMEREATEQARRAPESGADKVRKKRTESLHRRALLGRLGKRRKG